MQRYIILLDNATYMPCEHQYKEREYGIAWRTAFKKDLNAFADSLYRKMVGEEGFPETDDAFLFFHRIVKKDAIDAATFDALSQAEFMSMMTENLELLEKCLYVIKAMLKEPDHLKFQQVKQRTFGRMREQQKEMNPNRPNTAELNQAIAKKN